MKDITVDIQSTINLDKISIKLKQWANLVLDYVSISESQIEVLIVDQSQGEYYNMVFRKRSGPTNVLSFPDENNGGLIILCHPVVENESLQLERTLEERYFQVYSHGILHLCGYTHDYDQDTKIMEKIEDNLFEIFKKNKS